MNPLRIDLRSDTLTKPTPAMRDAMATAEVGDDVYGEDPTLNRLQEMAAERTGKEAALFVASGTMANQIAIRSHTQPGDAIITGQQVHVLLYESGAAAAISGVQAVEVGDGDFFSAADVEAAIFPENDHYATTSLVCIENTHNRSGGRVFPLRDQIEISRLARKRGLALHLDGARIFNASIATGDSVSDLCAPFDSISFCLSKGLGAPVGSLLCGSKSFIRRARRFRKMFGGGMRQAGILGAAGIYALDNNVERLAEDHARACALAQGLRASARIELVSEPETNMVVFEVPDARHLISRLAERDLYFGATSQRIIRAVTHLGIDDDIERAVEIVADSV
jgi:threonine aldolase